MEVGIERFLGVIFQFKLVEANIRINLFGLKNAQRHVK